MERAVLAWFTAVEIADEARRVREQSREIVRALGELRAARAALRPGG